MSIHHGAAHGAGEWANRLIVIAFLVVIATPGLGMILGVDRAAISEAEMRKLATWPEWSWELSAVTAWPDRFQRYFEDHFAFRSRLIGWRSSLLWNALRTSSSDTVIAGKQGWLFYGDDGGMQDYVQVEPFTDDQLERWRLTLERARDFLAARGIQFLFVIAPDKQMIYPEFMPTALHRMRDDYRADQLIAHMRERSTVDILDLRPALIAAKSSGLLYHLYDTHWNDRGALVGYQQIAMRLHSWYPQIEPLGWDQFEASPSAPSGDRTTMLGLKDRGKTTMPGLIPRRGWSAVVVQPAKPDPYGEDGTVATEIAGTDLPRAVMFRDSFSSRLIPFLSEHFSRIVYQWQNDFDVDLIMREHPDVVIQEVVARHLQIFFPTPEIIPAVSEPSSRSVSITDTSIGPERDGGPASPVPLNVTQ
jgi:alginate O-acetyltransferase complex protein AlgJ